MFSINISIDDCMTSVYLVAVIDIDPLPISL